MAYRNPADQQRATAAWRAAHPEKVREYRKRYYWRHLEKERAYKRKQRRLRILAAWAAEMAQERAA